MGVRLVILADLHLEARFAWAGLTLGRRWRQALRDALDRVVELTAEVRADALLCAGDLYEHDRSSPDTEEFLRSSFEHLHPTRVFIAPGNHDWYGPRSLYRQVEWTPNVRIFTEDRLEPVELEDGLTLWGAAHRAPAKTNGFLRSFRVDRGGIHLALFHGSERGGLPFQEEGKVPHAPFDEREIGAAGFHHAFVGHYHVPKDTPSLTYPGNPEPLTFGEEGERGIVIAEVLGDGTVRRERRRIARFQVHDRAVDVSGCRSRQEIRDRAAQALQGLEGVARLTLVGELSPGVDIHLPEDLADVAAGMDTVVSRWGDIRLGYDLDVLRQEQTVRGQFVRDVLAAEDLSEEQRRRVLLTGLRALDGRDDLEVG